MRASVRGSHTSALLCTALLLAAGPAGCGGDPGEPTAIVAGSGAVGFHADPGALRVIDGPGSAPSGTRWMAPGFLQVDADDLTLDGVYVKGGIDYYGSGTLAVRNSIVEGGAAWMVVEGRSPDAHLVIENSTLRWRPGAGPPYTDREWGVGAVHGEAAMTVRYCDISGTPDGIQNTGRGLFEHNYIHDLAVYGVPPGNTHNDGIQLYGARDVSISRNRIDLGTFDGVHQNAAVFLQPGGEAATGLRVVGNELRGGGFVLRLEHGTRDAVVADNRFAAPGAFGYVLVADAGAVATWRGNTTEDGGVLAAP